MFPLKKVTEGMGEEQKKQPNIAGRLGQVIYWFGCVLGVLSVPVAVWLFFLMGPTPGFYGGPVLIAVFALGAGLCCWLIGRAARFILKGD